MATNKRSVFIEVLNNGFVLTEDGKKTAIEFSNSVKKILQDKLESMISKLTTTGTNNMSITIEVEENVPQISCK